MLMLCCIRNERYEAVCRVSISKGRLDADKCLKSVLTSMPRGDIVTGDDARGERGAAEEVANAANELEGEAVLNPMNRALKGDDGSSLSSLVGV